MSSLGGATLGGPGGAANKKKKNNKKAAGGGGGATLGGATLGGSPAAAAPAEDKPAATGGASLGAPAATGGASLGAPAATGGASLGGASLGGATLGGESAASAAEKKKKKKAKKKAAAKAEGGEGTDAKKKKPADPKDKKKKKGGLSAAMKARIKREQELKEQFMREEEERIRKEEEEEARLEEEEAERQKELEKIKAVERAKRKANKKSKTQLAQEAKMERMRAQMEKRSDIVVAGLEDEETRLKREEEKQKREEERKRREEEEAEKARLAAEEAARKAAEQDDWEALLSDSDDEDAEVPEVKEEPKPEPKKEEPKKKSTDDGEESDEEEEYTGPPLRSPICCVLGHVDTGKTKLLDKIRRTNVQDGEAGGITQQIGATYFPMDTVKNLTKRLNKTVHVQYKIPGLLVIDTPGHESFTNLRARGSSLCDIAILVVDLMHGIEQQTIESINLLRAKKCPFVVALNKVDRLFDWNEVKNGSIREALKKQPKHVLQEYDERVKHVIADFAGQGLNACLYYENKNVRKNVSLIPTSAFSGEGIPDLLMLLIQLTQNLMQDRFFLSEELQATVLEVKVVEGLGTTIDVILSNGTIREGDTIVCCGLNGPICTTIRALLTPHPLKEIRVKTPYLHHKEVKAAQGIKITAQGLEGAIPGGSLLVAGPDDDLDELKEKVQSELSNMLEARRLDREGRGVYVQASTLGSLEALLEFLKSVDIPVSGINIGPIHKKDVMKASVMLEHDRTYAVILGFNVPVARDARELADSTGVQIFTAEIIYHLEQSFMDYMEAVKKAKQMEFADEAIFPCMLEIQENCIFHARDPITVGVKVTEGIAKVGTPIVVPSKDNIYLGRIISIEENHQQKDRAEKGALCAVQIQVDDWGQQRYLYGRHFDLKDPLVSKISRQSIDLMKKHYKEELEDIEVRKLIVKLKKTFKIL